MAIDIRRMTQQYLLDISGENHSHFNFSGVNLYASDAESDRSRPEIIPGEISHEVKVQNGRAGPRLTTQQSLVDINTARIFEGNVTNDLTGHTVEIKVPGESNTCNISLGSHLQELENKRLKIELTSSCASGVQATAPTTHSKEIWPLTKKIYAKGKIQAGNRRQINTQDVIGHFRNSDQILHDRGGFYWVAEGNFTKNLSSTHAHEWSSY